MVDRVKEVKKEMRNGTNNQDVAWEDNQSSWCCPSSLPPYVCVILDLIKKSDIHVDECLFGGWWPMKRLV